MDSDDKKLLNEIQTRFPITERPYRELGLRLGCSENEIIERIGKLKKKNIIRRIGANFESGKLGFSTTLCAASVPDDMIDKFVETVNSFPEVTHHYLRNHHYNAWFTFVAPGRERINSCLEKISKDTGVSDIINLPAERIFKISVNFDFSGS